MKIKIIYITIAIFLFAAILCGQAFAATVTYTYDNLNRLTKVDYGNGTTITYTHDAAGNRLTMTAVSYNDTDNDGIPDSWEITNFGNLTTADNTTDYDKDGLLDKDEYANNTDPKDTDSDNDGMDDGWEVTYGLNPLVDDSNGDLDGDGITNLDEYNAGTDPNQSVPSPHIKANDSDGPITLETSDDLSVKVSLEAGRSLGEDGDWWIVAHTPSGEWYYYDLTQGTYAPGLKVTYKGPLVNLDSAEILNISSLTAGTYTYYFGIDLDMDGELDMDDGFYSDSVEVIVTDATIPKIYANGSEGPVTISTGEQLAINISISSGINIGSIADWWLVADTPSGWQYYDSDLRTFASGLSATYQGGLFDLSSYEIYSSSGLGVGTYTFYFGVDLSMNGTLDYDEFYYDSVTVTVEAEAISAPTGFTASASGSTLTLSWNAVSGVDGYKLYYGYSSGNYAGSVDLGNVASKVVSNVPDGTYYLAITAYAGSNESSYPDEVSITVNPQSNASPTATITSPTSSGAYTTSSSSLNIGGTAHDDVGVTQVTWLNDRGGSGTASGTTSWSVNEITLQSGTNVIAVTASDSAGNTATDTLTVIYNPPSGEVVDSDGWQIETVDSFLGFFDTDSSLAFDASGNPAISYVDNTNTNIDLKYAIFNGTSWDITTVDSTADSETSLAFDASGNPAISYFDATDQYLKYAQFNGTSWDITTVDSTGLTGSFTSLAFDASGNPAISYNDYINLNLKYAHFNGTSWDITTVDSIGVWGWRTSLAFDASGNPAISYYDTTNQDLKYAQFNGISWDITTVDSNESVGLESSLAFDASGNPAISYTYNDFINLNLKYAQFNGTSWDVTTVDSTGFVGYDMSLAFDASGNPAISYYDVTNQDLKYAQFNGTSWDITTVDSTGIVGSQTSLAFDALGNPAISYHDATDGDLKYAHKLLENN